MTGWRGLQYKERRRERRKERRQRSKRPNHVAKDLMSPKYKQRVVPSKKKDKYIDRYDEEFY